jgi:hypothetical protein
LEASQRLITFIFQIISSQHATLYLWSVFTFLLFPGTTAAAAVGAGSDITAVLPGVNQSFPSDVEAEANSYFQKIYNQPPNPTMTIDEVLEMLKKFKDSTSKKEKVSNVFYVCAKLASLPT